MTLTYSDGLVWFNEDDEKFSFECLKRCNPERIYTSDEEYFDHLKDMLKSIISAILQAN